MKFSADITFSDPSLKSPQVTYTTANKRMWKLPMSTHPATCNLAHCLTRHCSPIWCFALPQLYWWWHQPLIFWVPPWIYINNVFMYCKCLFIFRWTCNKRHWVLSYIVGALKSVGLIYTGLVIHMFCTFWSGC
jgi:hypothetical protein